MRAVRATRETCAGRMLQQGRAEGGRCVRNAQGATAGAVC